MSQRRGGKPGNKNDKNKKPGSSKDNREPEDFDEGDDQVEVKENEDALQGKTEVDYPVTANIVRIFTSSTFTDTKVERNALMERVYPKLKEFCQERGYEFQVVDMRWGVRDEATDDHMTSELCMKEIKDCQKFSTGPNFITFLAQKYGYRPFPPKIQADEFEKMLGAVKDNDDQKLLKDWFILDENSVPSEYQLQPIRNKLPHYADESDPDKKKQARDEWWAAFEKMQIVLRDASKAALDDQAAMHKFFWSVTEEEIYHGILQADDTSKHCYWFKRNITDLLDNTKSKLARRFMDIAGGVDKEAFDLLSKLKDDLIPSKLEKTNIKDYEVKWTENAIDPANSKEHSEYIENFLKDFESTLKRMIVNGIKERKQTAAIDPLSIECIDHLQFAKSKQEAFQGRAQFLKDVKSALIDDRSGEPVVILGKPGSGKTTFLAKLVEEVPKWLGEEVILVTRFVGITSKSSTTRELLSSICNQFSKVCGLDEEVAKDPKELKAQFKEFVESCDKKVVILIDSLDQLQDRHTGLKDWIPTSLSDDVTMVLSSIPGEDYEVEPQLRNILSEESFINVPEFDQDEINDVIKYGMSSSHRTLQTPQQQILESACQKCMLPLYCKIALDEAKRWKSHTEVSASDLGDTIQILINDLFERVEKYHGKVLVSHALGYVTASKAGLSASEIEDILSCDDVVLKDVLQYHQPPQRRLPPLLWVRIHSDLREYLVTGGADGIQVFRWYHRQFYEVAKERYMGDEEQVKYLYTGLSEFFIGKWADGTTKPYVDHKTGKDSEAERFVAKQLYVFSEKEDKAVFNLRKINELPYNLIKTKDVELVKEHSLCNFEFLYEKMRAEGLDRLMDDFELAKKDGVIDKDIKEVYKALNQARDALILDPKQLPIQLVGRIAIDDKEDEGAIPKLIADAKTPHFDCYVTTQAFLKARGNALIKKYVENESQILAMATSDSGQELVTWTSMLPTLRIFDVEDGSVKQAIELNASTDRDAETSSYMFNKFIFIENDSKILAFTGGRIYVIDRKKETLTRIADFKESSNSMVATNVHFLPQKNTIVVMNDAPEIIWFKFPGDGKKISSVKVEEVNDAPFNDKCYLGGNKEDMIYYRAQTDKIHFFNLSNHKKTLKSLPLFKKSQIGTMVTRFGVTENGNVAAYIYEPPDSTKPVTPKLEDCKALVKIYNIKTASQTGEIKDVPGGWFLGYEHMITLDSDHVLFNCYQAFEIHYQKFNLKEQNYSVALKCSTMFTLMETGKDKNLFGVPMTEQQIVEEYDMEEGEKSAAPSTTDSKATPEWYGEGCNMLGLIPGSKRFAAFSTLADGYAIWDLATSRTIRSFEAAIYGQSAIWLSDKQIVFPTTQLKGLLVVDMMELKIVHNLPGVLAASNDNPTRFGVVQKDALAVVVGPENHQISFIKIFTGKVVSKIEMGKKGLNLGGVLVSKNEAIAISMEQQNVPGRKASVPAKDGITRIYVIDVKKKAKLSDIVIRGCRLPIHLSAVTTNTGYFMEDGSLFFSLKEWSKDQLKKRQNYKTTVNFWNLRTGKEESIPEDHVGTSPHRMAVSEPMKCVLVASTDYDVKLWSWETKRIIRTIPTPDNSAIYNLAVSTDGLMLSFMINVLKVYTYDLQNGARLGNIFSDNQNLNIQVPGTGNFLLVSMRTVLGIVQFYRHSKNKQIADIEEAFEKMKKEKDLFGEPKAVNKRPT